MRIVWVPQWTVLPVILEDQRMTSDSGSGGRLPSGSQPAEPLAHARPTDNSNPVGSSMCPFAGSSEFAPMSRPRQGVEQLTVTQKKKHNMSSTCRIQLLSSKCPGLILLAPRDSRHPTQWAEDSHKVPLAWLVWQERYPTTTIRPRPRCHRTNNTRFKDS